MLIGSLPSSRSPTWPGHRNPGSYKPLLLLVLFLAHRGVAARGIPQHQLVESPAGGIHDVVMPTDRKDRELGHEGVIPGPFVAILSSLADVDVAGSKGTGQAIGANLLATSRGLAMGGMRSEHPDKGLGLILAR